MNLDQALVVVVVDVDGTEVFIDEFEVFVDKVEGVVAVELEELVDEFEGFEEVEGFVVVELELELELEPELVELFLGCIGFFSTGFCLQTPNVKIPVLQLVH